MLSIVYSWKLFLTHLFLFCHNILLVLQVCKVSVFGLSSFKWVLLVILLTVTSLNVYVTNGTMMWCIFKWRDNFWLKIYTSFKTFLWKNEATWMIMINLTGILQEIFFIKVLLNPHVSLANHIVPFQCQNCWVYMCE